MVLAIQLTGHQSTDTGMRYSVPKHIQEHIDYIIPGVKLVASGHASHQNGDIDKRSFGWGKGRKPIGPPKKPLHMPWSAVVASARNALLLSICDKIITPPCIAAMYNITKAKKAAPGNELGIFEDLGDVYSQTDLDLFFATLASQIPQSSHPQLEAIDGAVAPTNVANAGPESDLDFQISYPIIHPLNSIFFQTDDSVHEANYPSAGFFNNFLDAIDGSYCQEYKLHGKLRTCC